jgi:hypothetical protein
MKALRFSALFDNMRSVNRMLMLTSIHDYVRRHYLKYTLIHTICMYAVTATASTQQAQKTRRGDAAAAGNIAEWTYPIPKVAIHPHHELITAQLLREFTTYGRGKGAARRVDLERRQGLVAPVFAGSTSSAQQQQLHVSLLPDLAHTQIDNTATATATSDAANIGATTGSSSGGGASATALLIKHLLSTSTTNTTANTTASTTAVDGASPVAAQWQAEGIFAPSISTEAHTVGDSTTAATAATTTLRELKAKAAFSLESLAAGTEEGCFGFEELRQLKTISLNKDRVGVYSRVGLRTSTSLDALAVPTTATASATSTTVSGSASSAKRRPHTAVTKGSVTSMYANATRELTRCATRHSKSRALTAVLPCTIEQQQQQLQHQQHQQQLISSDDRDRLASISSSNRRASVSAPVYSNGSSGMSLLSDAPIAITLANPITTTAITAATNDEQHHHNSAATAATSIHTGSSSISSGSNSCAVDELDAAVAQRLSSHQSTVITTGVTGGSSNSNVSGYVHSLSSAMLLAKAKARARRAETALCSESNNNGTSSHVYSADSGNASHSSSTAATAGAAADTLSRQNSTAGVASATNEAANSSSTSTVVAAAAAVMLKRASTPKQLLRQISGLGAPPTATVTKVAAIAGESLAAERLRKAEERAEANRITELAVVVRRIAALIVLQTEASRKREAEGRNKQHKRPNTTKQPPLKPVTDTTGTSSTAADTAIGVSAVVAVGVQSSKDALKHGGRHSSSSGNTVAGTAVKPTRVKGSMRPGGLGPHYSLAGKSIYL